MKNIDLLKDYHMNKLMNFIRKYGPISRVELSKKLNIPQPTVTRMIDKLIQEQLIIESGLGDSSRGRRPILLGINRTCFYSIGVEIGRSVVKIAITDLAGNMVITRKKETDHKGSIVDILAFINTSIDEMSIEKDIEFSKLLGVGIGLPGPLTESKEGLLTISNFYDVKQIPFRKMLQKTFSLPVTLDINANAAALAEKWLGKGVGCNNFVYIIADAGIGSGIIINGELYRGSNGESGIIGHAVVDIFGEKCSCGNYGCLETLVSTTKVIENVQKQLKINRFEEHHILGNQVEALQFEDIVSFLQKGSVISKKVVQEAGQFLGVGIANVINLFDPEIIVIGGRLGQLGDVFLDSISATVQSRVLGYGGKCTEIVTSDFKDGVVLGAAALVISKAFSFENSYSLV